MKPLLVWLCLTIVVALPETYPPPQEGDWDHEEEYNDVPPPAEIEWI